MNKRRIALMILILMVLTLMACDGAITTGSDKPLGYPMVTPSSMGAPSQLPDNSLDSVYSDAQATLIAGQKEKMELAHQATLISLNINQAANAAAQTTMDYNQRQLMELSIRNTEVSQNMARAVATQQFIVQQTQMVLDANATAQSQAATATYAAYALSVTQTAQAQALLDVQSTHTAQENAALAVYSLTATPWAAIQADIARTRDEAERRALWDEFVVTPLRVILLTLVVLLLLAGGVMAYRRLMPLLDLRLRTIWRDNDRPLLLVDGTIMDPEPSDYQLPPSVSPHPNLAKHPDDEFPAVEIVGPDEPSVTNWITEAEQELRSDGGVQP